MVATAESKPARPNFAPLPGVDWVKVRDEYVSGSPTKELSAKYNIKKDTINARAYRENWSKLRLEYKNKPKPEPKLAVIPRVQSPITFPNNLRPESLNASVLSEASKLLASLNSMHDWGDVKTMESHARILRCVNDTARKALGLDSPNGWGPGISRDSLAVRPAGLAAPHPVIDVESSEQAAPTGQTPPEPDSGSGV